MKKMKPASFALKASHCLKNIGNFQRYFQNAVFLNLMILKSSISNNDYLFFIFFYTTNNFLLMYNARLTCYFAYFLVMPHYYPKALHLS